MFGQRSVIKRGRVRQKITLKLEGYQFIKGNGLSFGSSFCRSAGFLLATSWNVTGLEYHSNP